MELSRRKLLGFDRTWSIVELDFILDCAEEKRRSDYVCAIILAYEAGLRIHECCRIDTATAENALKSGILTIKGKNGKIRSVDTNETITGELRRMLEITERGEKLLVPKRTPTHIYIKHLQHFIGYHRKKLPEREGKEELTFHGLRHAFAVRKYTELIENGYTEGMAKREVSKLLGHERKDVMEVYLAAIREEGDENES